MNKEEKQKESKEIIENIKKTNILFKEAKKKLEEKYSNKENDEQER